MPETEPTSAVVVRVGLPGALERLRCRHDPGAARGVPAHVTLLFPFLPVIELSDEVRPALAAIARGTRPFEVRFARVGRFPDVVYLAPEPAAPFARLTAELAARFPEYPPYGGAFEEVIPHLTLAESDETSLDSLDSLATAATAFLPFAHRIQAIEVLAERPGGTWHRLWRIPLGIRP